MLGMHLHKHKPHIIKLIKCWLFGSIGQQMLAGTAGCLLGGECKTSSAMQSPLVAASLVS